ncbi:MAG: NAD(P)/FAD-dependent oxidoreductase [Pseudomonadota bacterium]
MTTKRDVLVVGAGINGLSAAAYLARRGCRVVLLEAAESIGGAARTIEFAPGLRAPLAAHLLPPVTGPLRRLPLARFGWQGDGPAVESIALLAERRSLDIDTPSNNSIDADIVSGWQRFDRETAAIGALLRRPLQHAPLSLVPTTWRARGEWLRAGAALARHGPRRVREALRVVTMSVADYVSEFVTEPDVAGVLCQDGLWGTSFGPRAPGTMLGLLYRRALLGRQNRWLGAAGRSASLLDAIAACALDRGADIRTASPVRRILVESGKATGVELVGGEVVRALNVVSAIDPRTTLLQLVGPAALEAGAVRAARHIRRSARCARVFVAVSSLPSFVASDKAAHTRIVIAATPPELEDAADRSQRGDVAPHLSLEVTVPTAADASLAPAGTHILSISVHYVPAGSASEQAVLAATIDRLAEHDPNFPSTVIASTCLGPESLGQHLGGDLAHWHHSDLTMDQFLFTRPLAAAPRYRSPVDGLFFASAGAHPGGGVTGWPGCLAAEALLRS